MACTVAPLYTRGANCSVEGVDGRVGGSRFSVATEFSPFGLWQRTGTWGCVSVARRAGRGLGLGRSPRVRASGSELLDDG